MTLGKKLAVLRKQHGLSQQNLGDELHVSAQAVSKWENDLAEPDLTTLKKLAQIYKVSIDLLLDADQDLSGAGGVDTEALATTVSEAVGKQLESKPQAIGYCKNCGIAVTKENYGAESPYVMCKSCYDTYRAGQASERQNKEGALRDMKKQRRKSIFTGIAFGIWPLILAFVCVFSFPLEDTDTWLTFVACLILSYSVFSFAATLRLDSPVQNMMLFMLTRSVRWPGIIFSFDLEGLFFLIGLKILFAVLSFIVGLVLAAIGVIIGLIISPFVFPISIVKFNEEIKEQQKCVEETLA